MKTTLARGEGSTKECAKRSVAAWFVVAGGIAMATVAGGMLVEAAWRSAAGRILAAGVVLAGFAATAALALVVASALLRRRLLPLSSGAVRALVCVAYGPVRTVGRLLGCTDECLQRSFLHLQNEVALTWWDGRAPTRLLVLLPHCLQTGIREQIESLLGRYECVWQVVNGGSQALAAVRDVAPDRLIAVACERDLLHGILGVRGGVPWVYVHPNIQGETPCKATSLDVNHFADIMEAVAVPRSEPPAAPSCTVGPRHAMKEAVRGRRR